MNQTSAASLSWALHGDQVIWRSGEPALALFVDAMDIDHPAVRELTLHMGIITGADWSHVRHTDVTDGGGIVLAMSRELADEQVRIRLLSDRDTLLLEGGGDRGVLYAVYEFLEGLGVRWFAPGDMGLHAPRMDAMCVPSGLDRRSAPSIADRGLHICGHGKLRDGSPHVHYDHQTLMWMLRNRMNFKPVHNSQIDTVGPMLEQMHLKPLAYGHSYDDWFTDDDFARHPQYFALVNDKRLRGGQLCLSNQAMCEQLVQRIVAFIDEHPRQEIISLAPNDGYKFCECDHCRKMDSPEDRAGGNITRRHHLFAADIAKRVREQRRGVLVSTLSYANYLDVSHDIAPQPALAISACITRSLKHSIDDPASSTNRKVWDRVQQWVQKSGHVSFAEYYLSYGGLYPRAYEKATVATIKALRDAGIKGFKSEVLAGGSPQWQASVLHLYLVARYLWDADQSLPAVLDDFYTGYYGSSAAACRAIHQRLSQAIDHYDGEIRAMDAVILPDVFSEDDVAALTALAAGAAQSIDEPYASRAGNLRDQCALIATSRREVVQVLAEPSWLAVAYMQSDPSAYQLRNRTDMLPLVPRTWVRLGRTNTVLIVDMLVDQPPRHRDHSPDTGVWGQSHVDLFFCGDPQSEVYYQIAVDYHGDVYTARCRKRSWDSDHRVPVEVHVDVTETSWRLRLHIALAALDVDPTSATSMLAGLNVSIKNDYGSSRYGGWPRGGAFHDISKFGELRFEGGVSP